MLNAQDSPCSHESILERMSANNPNIYSEIQEDEAFIQKYIEENKGIEKDESMYTIPVVLHVFHIGEDGMIDMEQAQSGLDILNDDINGLNDGWNDIDPLFDPIKGTVDINFCLSSIDPNGNPTTGVIYHEDELNFYNYGNVTNYAWDNYKYLNIYLPRFAFNDSTDFTAYAYYPSTSNSNVNGDGVVHSSYRWGFGSQSEHEPGAEWASVVSHEVGHWLNLAHTFQSGCNGNGDSVSDTPPTIGTGINFDGCYTNDFSCGEATNGSNFMDYNHGCKKMFTQGQADRMMAALNLPSRAPLWSKENLLATGCKTLSSTATQITNNQTVKAFPNPAMNMVNFTFEGKPLQFSVYDVNGKKVFSAVKSNDLRLDISGFSEGIYFYQAVFKNETVSGKFSHL
ncbi:MAG: hypothetical protein ACI85O_003303 [Saprospiraceae bacterium]|jgi:hypothetical protein